MVYILRASNCIMSGQQVVMPAHLGELFETTSKAESANCRFASKSQSIEDFVPGAVVSTSPLEGFGTLEVDTHTHIHTHIYIYTLTYTHATRIFSRSRITLSYTYTYTSLGLSSYCQGTVESWHET